MFGLFGKNKVKEAIKKGAVIIDVRTPHEYDNGKVPGSINIPVDRISVSVERIRSISRDSASVGSVSGGGVVVSGGGVVVSGGGVVVSGGGVVVVGGGVSCAIAVACSSRRPAASRRLRVFFIV